MDLRATSSQASQRCTRYPVSPYQTDLNVDPTTALNIFSNKRQCTNTWEQHTDWNGRLHSWPSWRLYSQSPFMSSIGMDLRFGKSPRSRRLWLPTGRRLVGGFLSVVLVIRILCSDTCQGTRREKTIWVKGRAFQGRWERCVAPFDSKICSIQLLVRQGYFIIKLNTTLQNQDK